VKARSELSNTLLRAPVDGVVERLAIHTIGGVVSPAQPLLVVVPDHGGLMVEAQLANRDVGFVHPGQEVALKVETYDYTRYGFLHGKVLEVSRDTVADTNPGPTRESAEPPGGISLSQVATSPTYQARIAIDRSAILINGQARALIPGMAVTAEIRTGRRTILEYLVSPISKKIQESLHER
jgi:hemolysin D